MTTKVPSDKKKKFEKGTKNVKDAQVSIIAKMLLERGIDTTKEL